LIAEFYATRQKPPDGHVLLEHNRLRTASALYDQFMDAILRGGPALSDADRERLRRELPAAQAEIQAFINFLKAKFIENAQ
jgi:hypothetical protein